MLLLDSTAIPCTRESRVQNPVKLSHVERLEAFGLASVGPPAKNDVTLGVEASAVLRFLLALGSFFFSVSLSFLLVSFFRDFDASVALVLTFESMLPSGCSSSTAAGLHFAGLLGGCFFPLGAVTETLAFAISLKGLLCAAKPLLTNAGTGCSSIYQLSAVTNPFFFIIPYMLMYSILSSLQRSYLTHEQFWGGRILRQAVEPQAVVSPARHSRTPLQV